MGYFTRSDHGFDPLPFAQSQWAPGAINGSALAGLAAYALEASCTAPDYRVAKFTMDIFRQPAYAPVQTETLLIREGRSMRIADVVVRQGERMVARGSMVAIRPSQEPAGLRWQPTTKSMTWSDQLAAALPSPGILWGSDGHSGGWSSEMAEHQNSGRKRLWFDQPRLFSDEDNSPFMRAAMVGELTNTLTSWSNRGIGFINHDVTLLLARLPADHIVGIEADNHISADGIAAGTASMWDSQGQFGISVVGSVAHAAGNLDAKSGPEEWSEADHAHEPEFDSTA